MRRHMRLLIALLLLAMVVDGPALAAARTGDGVGRFYEDAVTDFHAGRTRSALIQLKNALRENPDHLPSLILLGRVNSALGDGAGAEIAYKRALDAGAAEDHVLIPMAEALLLQRDFTRVLTEIRSGNRTPLLEGEVDRVRGEALIGQGRLEAAAASFIAGSEKDPGSPGPLRGLAHVRAIQGQWNDATEILQRAVDLDPGDPDTWLATAQFMQRRRSFGDALNAYDRVVRLRPGDLAALRGRGAVYFELGALDKALEDLTTVRDAAPNDPWAAYYYALVQGRKGNDEDAAKAILQAFTWMRQFEIGESGAQPPAMASSEMYLSGLVAFSLGLTDKAELLLTRYVGEDPYHPGARLALGRLLTLEGDVHGAIDVLEPARTMIPSDPRFLAILGDAYLDSGQPDKSIEVLQWAAAELPNAAAIHRTLGQAYLAYGIRSLNRALRTTNPSIEAGVLLAEEHVRGGEPAKALTVVRTAMEVAPDNAALHNLKGEALAASGQRGEARASFERAIEIAPDYVDPQFNLAEIEEAEGRPDEARIIYMMVLG